jgi:hypothetical protein
MLGTIYRDAVSQGMSPRRAIHMIARAQGVPASKIRRQLGIR